jgi:hypothetical protein
VPVVRFGPEVPEVIEALRLCWAVLDEPSGKRLAAALPRLVGALRAHGELVIDDGTAGLLCSMSAATIDRPAPCRGSGSVAGQGRLVDPAGVDAQVQDRVEDLGGMK